MPAHAMEMETRPSDADFCLMAPISSSSSLAEVDDADATIKRHKSNE